MFRYRLILRLRLPEQTIPDMTPEHFEAMKNLMSDRVSSVRQAAVYFFARTADPRAEKPLALASSDGNPWTRFFAFNALARMKAKASNKEIEKGIADTEQHVRLAALGAGLAAEMPVLRFQRLMKDESFHVRAAFARALNAKLQPEAALLEKM